MSIIFAIIAYLFAVHSPIKAQDTTPTPSPSSSPSMQQAHLTFRTCLIPNTQTFRLSYRADYVAGEYRIVAQNSGGILNMGYLEVSQEGGGFGEDNTTYVLHEDTWIKQWYNGTRWQRAGGLPVTSVSEHIESGSICEIGTTTPYIMDTPYISNVSPTPQPTPSPQVQSPNEQGSPAIGGIPQPTLAPTNSPQVLVANNYQNKQVLGASSLGDTGSFTDVFLSSLAGVGSLLVATGIRQYKKTV